MSCLIERRKEQGFLKIAKDNTEILVPTFFFKNKICWIATDILKVLDYKSTRGSLSQMFNKDNLYEKGIDYDVLKDKELEEFKDVVENFEKENSISTPLFNKKAPAVTIFYESGVFLFLLSSKKNKDNDFKKWIIREVIPSISNYGIYVTNEVMDDPEKLIGNLNTLLEKKQEDEFSKKFKFQVMLKEDAEENLVKERAKNRELKKIIRNLKDSEDKYGNKLTSYELDNWS